LFLSWRSRRERLCGGTGRRAGGHDVGVGDKVGPSLGQLAVLSISGVLHISGLALSPPNRRFDCSIDYLIRFNSSYVRKTRNPLIFETYHTSTWSVSTILCTYSCRNTPVSTSLTSEHSW
jgi:hypothetical protein